MSTGVGRIAIYFVEHGTWSRAKPLRRLWAFYASSSKRVFSTHCLGGKKPIEIPMKVPGRFHVAYSAAWKRSRYRLCGNRPLDRLSMHAPCETLNKLTDQLLIPPTFGWLNQESSEHQKERHLGMFWHSIGPPPSFYSSVYLLSHSHSLCPRLTKNQH